MSWGHFLEETRQANRAMRPGVCIADSIVVKAIDGLTTQRFSTIDGRMNVEMVDYATHRQASDSIINGNYAETRREKRRQTANIN